MIDHGNHPFKILDFWGYGDRWLDMMLPSSAMDRTRKRPDRALFGAVVRDRVRKPWIVGSGLLDYAAQAEARGRQMRTVFLALAILVCLVGCTSPNTNITTLQLSGNAEPFPTNYQDIAAKAVAGRPIIEDEVLQISYPQPLLGQTVFSAKRWYVCVRGLSTTKKPPVPRKTTLLKLAGNVLSPPVETGVYQALIFIKDGVPSSVRFVFDAGLCRDLKYKRLSMPT